ncbi:hypothetical protein GQ53DRAFT_752999 [Thozetella sp. PMI_491]|nr:hypothetical protein GQ53DRAFT_752999 [Thozetella sp. PMI_491]
MDEDPPLPLGRGRGPSSASSVAPLYGSQASSKTKAAGKQRLRFAEEQRASWPRSWHSKSDKGEKGEKSERSKKGDKKGEKSSKGAAPPVGGVYWSEEGDPNESQYTFYREGTPTPPEYNDEDRERALQYGRTPGGRGHGRGPSQGTIPSFDPPPLHPFGGRVCGMRKRLFWALVIIFGVILVAVGIGAGVGVGLARKSTSSNAASSNHNATSSPSPAQVTATATSSAPSATSSEPTSALCGNTNNTIYSVPNSNKKFRRFCGIDFSGVGGAMDETSVLTSNMEECMISCSGLASCTGCGWGIVVGDEGPKHKCWLKSNLQTAHNTSSDWSFAILL